MNADKFVEDLKLCAPSESELISDGLSMKSAKDFIEYYICRRRDASLNLGFPHMSELINLINNYHLNHVEIGPIRFLGLPYYEGPRLLFGRVESDDLFVSAEDMHVWVSDFKDPNALIWCAATDGTKFLDALIIAAQFYKSHPLMSTTDEEARLCADECAEAAGDVKKCIGFYRMLQGV